MTHTYRLVFDCPDQPGIVNRVSDLITRNGGWISQSNHHSETASNWFFSRIEVFADSLDISLQEFEREFQAVAAEFDMNWRIVDSAAKKRVVLMVSKGTHCLADLLDRWASKELDCDIVAVISNHEKMRALSEFYGIDYYYVSIDKDNKQVGFNEVERLVDQCAADAIVLARYMQIIPSALCEKYQHQVINIHHSFLPSFIGAKPYHQAHNRGVKLIGATCHYVTQQLDEGPIIEQDVVRISHRDSIEDMVRKGRDCEVQVLARSLRAHLQDRVIVQGNKTIVFD